jgi:hypothetical protein
MGTVWELHGNQAPSPPLHPLGGCWCHPIGAPHMLYPTVFFEGTKLLGWVLPMYGIVF